MEDLSALNLRFSLVEVRLQARCITELLISHKAHETIIYNDNHCCAKIDGIYIYIDVSQISNPYHSFR